MHMNRTFIIAEAGVNHNGDMVMAKDLIDAAKAAGADAVKFQTFKSEQVVSRQAAKAAYQQKTTSSSENQLAMLKRLELSLDDHEILIAHCRSAGIQFLSTPFDLESIALLNDRLHLPMLKIPSGEITNGPLLLALAHTGKPLIMSTGLATLDEVATALQVLVFGYIHPSDDPSAKSLAEGFQSDEGQAALRNNVSLLHCTSEYPAPYEDVNLRAMDTLREAFGLPVGLSDHSVGISIPIAAVARGAEIIEKHFTLDRSLPGPDHAASLEPDELTAMVAAIRQVESALGSGKKLPAPSETKNISAVRRSLVAAIAIKKGEAFSPANLTAKRPASGLSPMRYWELLGKTAERDYAPDEMIECNGP